VRVISELAGSVDSLLHVEVLTAELLDLAFDGVLHEVLLV